MGQEAIESSTPRPTPVAPAFAAWMAAHPARDQTELAVRIHEWRSEGDWECSDEELRRRGFHVVERTVDGFAPGDRAIPLLVCRPTEAAGLVPVIYFIHGGAFLSGTNRTLLDHVVDYAEALDAAVVSVDYRLAPENPYPAPLHDCVAGLLGLVDIAADFALDMDRVVLAGLDAGSGLAAGVALMMRDSGLMTLAGMLLEGPMLDDRSCTRSMIAMDGRDVWNRADNARAWQLLLGSTGGSGSVSPYAVPAREDDLTGLPPAFVDVGSAETLRDEAIEFVEGIWNSGGVAELHVWPGGCHCFDIAAPDDPVSRRAKETRIDWMRRVLT